MKFLRSDKRSKTSKIAIHFGIQSNEARLIIDREFPWIQRWTIRFGTSKTMVHRWQSGSFGFRSAEFHRHCPTYIDCRRSMVRRSVHVSSAFPNCTCCTWGQVHTSQDSAVCQTFDKRHPSTPPPFPASETDISYRFHKHRAYPSFSSIPYFHSWSKISTKIAGNLANTFLSFQLKHLISRKFQTFHSRDTFNPLRIQLHRRNINSSETIQDNFQTNNNAPAERLTWKLMALEVIVGGIPARNSWQCET